MTRINPAQCQKMQLTTPEDWSALDLKQARQWLACQNPTNLPQIFHVHLLSLNNRRAQKTLLRAAFEHYKKDPEMTASLQRAARERHFKLAELLGKEQLDQLVSRSAKRSNAQRTLQRAMSRQAAAKSAAHPASQSKEEPVEITQLRIWLQAVPAQEPARAFNIPHHRDLNLWAVGQLKPAEVAAFLRSEGAPPKLLQRLEVAVFQRVRDQVIDQLRDKLLQALDQVTLLQQDSAYRRSFLASSPDPAALAKDLRALGVEPQQAERCAQKSPGQDELLTQALDQATRGLKELAYLSASSRENDKSTLALFELCTPLVEKLQEDNFIRPDSFARQAIDRGLACGRRQRALDQVGRALSGLSCNIVVGVLTGGTSLWVQALGSVGASAVSGLPNLAQKSTHLRQAVAAEGLDSARAGTGERARRELEQAEESYVHSLGNSALFSPLGTLSSSLLSQAASEAENQLQPR